MSIRARLLQKAEDDINDMVEQLERAAGKICDGRPITVKELARIVGNERSTTLISKLKSRFADQAEEKLAAFLDQESAGNDEQA